MTVRNCFLAPWRPGPPQVWSLAVATLAAPLLQHLDLCQRQPCSTHLRKVLFRTLRSASSSASEIASEGLSGHLTWCLGRALFLWPSETASAQRLQQCVRDCFGRPLTPSHLVAALTAFWHLQTLVRLRSTSSSAAETASEGLSGHLTWRLGRTLFLWTSETAFWHPQTLITLRSASSSASKTASEGLSRHLTWCLGRTLFLWPFETAFWHPQNLVTLRSASSSASKTASEGSSNLCNPAHLWDCLGRPLERL